MLAALRNDYPVWADITLLTALLLAALLAWILARLVLVATVHRFARRTDNIWDDALIEHKVPGRLAQLLPAVIIHVGVDLLPGFETALQALLLKATAVYTITVLTLVLVALLGAAHAIYESYPAARQRPLKGLVQLLQLGLIIIGLLLVVAELLNRSPWILLSGFGAMTAVLSLIFKDTILSLVASVQLATHDLVRKGDWIEVPQFGADGDVIEVELHTVKVQNWDKTITTIPTSRLIGDSFKNWRGMARSGGRRIKRALALDVGSIRFLTDTELKRFKQFTLLKQYIAAKERELDQYNQALQRELAGAASANINLRRLTNVGTFRAYACNYLKHHPRIHKEMTLLVRQLATSAEGLLIELYCFTNTTDWDAYEAIQGDVFDHLMAIVPEFGLRLYQRPAGADIRALQIADG